MPSNNEDPEWHSLDSKDTNPILARWIPILIITLVIGTFLVSSLIFVVLLKRFISRSSNYRLAATSAAGGARA